MFAIEFVKCDGYQEDFLNFIQEL